MASFKPANKNGILNKNTRTALIKPEKNGALKKNKSPKPQSRTAHPGSGVQGTSSCHSSLSSSHSASQSVAKGEVVDSRSSSHPRNGTLENGQVVSKLRSPGSKNLSHTPNCPTWR